MPSSFSFLLNSQSNSSSSSSENDLNSDQSDDDDDDDINIGYYKKRTIENDNDMLECPSDHDDSCSQSDVSDNNDEKENDHFTSSNKSPTVFLTRQLTLYADDWPRKSSLNENKTINRDDDDNDDTLFIDSNQHRLFSPERSKSVGTVDRTHQSRNIHTLSPSNFTTSAQELYSMSEKKILPPVSKTKIDTTSSRIRTTIRNDDIQRPISKIPIRTNSSSQSRSRSPTTTKRRIQSPTISSKIPIPISTISKGAFRFFTSDDHHPSSSSSLLPLSKDSIKISNENTKQLSPFTPITPSKTYLSTKKTSSSAGNTPLLKHRHVRTTSSDDDNSETNNLKEVDLKLKLKEQKRYGKQTGELLDKLHENYEELLEKYAQAENTIDQLRFQPKLFGDNTPTSNASEGMVHFIQQPRVNIASIRSNGIYHSTSGTPLSSVKQMMSTTTTTTTPAVKSISSANSCTVESVFFDEPIPQKIIVQELTTPETVKLDLLLQTKTLSEKMKSFLTLMDANQLSLAEQKQVYESIKEDYEKLLKVFDRTKQGNELSDIDLDADLNQELETMKQLLKEIVKRITDNLLGKSITSSETSRNGRLTRDESHSSQASVRSSLCNHGELMDQYQKLLHAVNTGNDGKKNERKSIPTGLELESKQMKKSTSRDSSRSETSTHLPPSIKSQKPYVYVSGNSDDEQQQSNGTTPIPLIKGIESTSFGLNYIPTTSIKHHQQINEEQTHIRGTTATTKKKKSSNKQEIQEYDNLDNITKSKRKIKTEQKKISNNYQSEKELTPSSLSIPTGTSTRHSACSRRTRTSDYDSGIGTNNTTKLSRDSKLNATIMDESHYQSLDDERRHYSDEEQKSMSSVSSSRSSGSGAVSPGSPYSKYTKRFNSSSSLKQLNDNSRRKPSGHSDIYSSDIETHITGSFDPLPQPTSYKKNSRRNHHSYQPQRTIYQPYQRSLSTENLDIENSKTKLHRPQTAPQTSHYYKMGKKYQSGFIRRHTQSSINPQSMYKSSFYIDQPHTTNRRTNENSQLYYKQIQTSNTKQTNNLYLDPQTGIIYRYIPSNTTQPSVTNYHQPTSSSKELYKCNECGSLNTYHHRHHINSNIRRVTNDIDDPGYESGHRKINRHRYTDHIGSSDSDRDENSTYFDMAILNEAYERAKKVQHHSQNLSKHISRQLKLVLATI